MIQEHRIERRAKNHPITISCLPFRTASQTRRIEIAAATAPKPAEQQLPSFKR